jgi:phosphoribosylanthranilate isomerase
LQFHGDESPAFCEALQRPYIKALRVKPGDDLVARVAAYGQASGVLLDTYVPGIPGGTGEAFDWSLVPQGLSKPIILAGGLVAENVAAAIRQVRPYAVDVSGGVEARKGIKDAEKIRAFMRAVKTA